MSEFVKNKYLIAVFLDISLLLALGATISIVDLIMTPVRSGYLCDDQSLKYSSKESTFNFESLIILSVGIPIVVTVCLDFIQNRLSLRSASLEIYKSIIYFAYGFMAHTVLLIVLKNLVGRPRPHFYDVCSPVLSSGLECTTGLYVQDYICSNENFSPKRIQEAYQSFPSGHASYIVYGMSFLILYLETRVKYKSFRLLKAIFQFTCVMLAVVVCMSRITDNYHHWTDVVAGGLIGLVFAGWSTYLCLKHNMKL